MTPPIDVPAAPRKRSNVTMVVMIVLGIAVAGCLFLMVGIAAVFFPVYRQRQLAAGRAMAIRRMSSLSMATLMYANENDGRLPVADSWMDGISKYDGTMRDFHSPNVSRREALAGPGYGIAFMKPLSAMKLVEVDQPAQRVMLFDSTLLMRNAASGLETLPKPPRFGKADNGGNVIAFADGHTRLVSAAAAVDLR